MPKVNGGWELPPLATPLLCTLDPDWEVLVHQERLWSWVYTITRLFFPDRGPCEEDGVAGLVISVEVFKTLIAEVLASAEMVPA